MAKKLLSTREVAEFINVNEKMVYTLVAEKGLPASKVTGKWLFPRHLVEQWIEANTTNYPSNATPLPAYHGLLIFAGSNDLLLDKAITLFNSLHPEHVAVFGNLGSMGGLRALRNNLCHIASSHLMQDDGSDYNFDFASQELNTMPAVVNFCRRQQGLLVGKKHSTIIKSLEDLAQPKIRIVNRPLGTGTRLLFDRLLKRAGIKGEKIQGYDRYLNRHMDVGLEILSGRADAGPGIKPVASILGLNFIPFRWERYDLLISKDRFFDPGVQLFQGMLHDKTFRNMAQELDGYDLESSGKMIFPQE